MEQRQYQVSVITPFHNVDIDMFRRCYASLQGQSLGFENIQWIVVLHNTKPEIRKEAEELLKGQENIILKVLGNDVHTPSSPRNCGLELATAPYVGFLDGDDSYTPLCLQKSVAKIRQHSAQMVVFRREYELAQEGLFPLTEIVLWDQTREEILIDRDNWDDEKMFTGIWGMVTSRLFDREFLAKNNITFDEGILYGEDILFLVEAYGRAERICYLPQFIGYHYFINGGSIVQGMAGRPGSVLAEYARGFSRIFAAAFRNGIYIDYCMGDLLTMFAKALISSETLTLSQRREIKEILEPFVHKIPLLPINKLNTEQEARLRYELPREIILHPETFEMGSHTQSLWNGEVTLLEILQQNKDTDYGRRYNFSSLRAAEGYQARVPLSDYSTYAAPIELQLKIGEHGILAAAPVKYYLLSEDEKGLIRLFPTTRKHLEPYVNAFADMVRGKTSFALLESLPKGMAGNDGGALNSLSGVILSEFFWRERNTLQLSRAKFTAPEELLFPAKAIEVLYLRVLFALKDASVEQLVSPSTWGIAETLAFMEKHWETICNDIERGEITFSMDVSEEYLRRMRGHLGADRERAEELRQAFGSGFERGLLARIWPKLRKIIAFGDGSFRIYTDRLKKYTGDIPLDNGYFMAAEGLIGQAVAESDRYRLLEGHNFYEFLPMAKEAQAKPLLLTQLKEGEIYELIVTNQAGLYRYRTGYFIRPEERDGGSLIFSLTGRRGQGVRVGGTWLEETDIYRAIAETAPGYGLDVMDFAFYGDEGGLTIFLEPASLGNLQEVLLHTAPETIAASLEDFWRREKGCTAPCRILWSETQTHLLYRDLRRFREQSAPYQIEPSHCLNTPEKIKFFTKMSK